MAESDINERYQSFLAKFNDIVLKNDLTRSNNSGLEKTVANNVQENKRCSSRWIDDHDILPLEYFMNVEIDNRRKLFFQSIQAYNIVFGEVIKISSNYLTVAIQLVLFGQKRYIGDLKIEAFLEDHCESDINYFELHDKIKGVVTYVDRDNEFLKISFDKKCLSPSQNQEAISLGKVDDEELDKILSFESNRRYSSLERNLLSSRSFVDPHCLGKLIKQLGIDSENSSFLSKRKSVFNDSLESIREKQSYDCSMQLVKSGIVMFKEKRNKEALEHFEQAIALYSGNVEAYVARGALHANKEKLKDAIEDFRKALSIQADHKNARSYFIEISLRMAKSHESKKKWRDSAKCYKEILKYDPNNKDAKERFHQVNQILSNKIILGGNLKPHVETCSSSSLPVNSGTTESLVKRKSKEKIERLKRLLLESGDEDSSDGWVEKPARKERRTSSKDKPSKYSSDIKSKQYDRQSRHSEHKSKANHSRSSGRFGSSRNVDDLLHSKRLKSEGERTDKFSEFSDKLKHFSSAEKEMVKKLLSKDSKTTNNRDISNNREENHKQENRESKSLNSSFSSGVEQATRYDSKLTRYDSKLTRNDSYYKKHSR